MWNVLLYKRHRRSKCHKQLCILAKSNNPELPYLCTTLMHILPLSFQAIISRHMMCFSQRPQTLHKWNREIDPICQLDFPFESVMRKIWPKTASSVNQRSALTSASICLAPEFLKDCRHIFRLNSGRRPPLVHNLAQKHKGLMWLQSSCYDPVCIRNRRANGNNLKIGLKKRKRKFNASSSYEAFKYGGKAADCTLASFCYDCQLYIS